jgi:hypothetical protein
MTSMIASICCSASGLLLAEMIPDEGAAELHAIWVQTGLLHGGQQKRTRIAVLLVHPRLAVHGCKH